MKAVFFFILAMAIMVANARVVQIIQIDSTNNAAVEQSSLLAQVFQPVGSCTRAGCTSMCRALACIGGSCISSNTCQCFGCFSDSEERVPSVPEVPAKSVDHQSSIRMGGSESCLHGQCDALCKLIGYHHGSCSSPTTCTCY